ncbi:MAG: cyclic nucleotide-binding domain-containing protein [Chloroflexota bacterium]|nr:cyclic nucleotide-binding domain-containing protein [Chloroflexota bacterium]
MPYEDVLGSAPLFSQLSRKSLTRLGRSAVERKFAKGETIVREGETAAAFFMLTKGRVAVVRGDGATRSDILNEINVGGFFGEMSLLDGAPRMASIKALDDTECLVLSRWDFLAELRTTPEIAVAMLPILTQRVRDLDARLGERD